MGNFRTIFFDFDGTLGDTEPDIRDAWQNAIAKLGLSCTHFDEIFRVGPALPETAKMLFPEASDKLRQEIQEAYKSFYDEAVSYRALPYPGIIDTVQTLAADGVKIFTVTNKRLKPARKLLDKFNLSDCCAGLFTPDIIDPEFQFTKTELVRLALRVSCADTPAEVLIVGDTEIDIAAGKAHGLSTCGVTWGYGRRDIIAAAEPDFIVDRADEILTL